MATGPTLLLLIQDIVHETFPQPELTKLILFLLEIVATNLAISSFFSKEI